MNEQEQTPFTVEEEAGANHYRSRDIRQLAVALAQVQQRITDAQLDGFNPHHGSRYASLSSVWAVARAALKDSGIAVLQFPATNADAGIVSLETQLVHSSGQFVACLITARIGATDERQTDQGTAKNKNLAGVQKLGGAITYLRRYALTTMLGICSDEDTDGNSQGQQSAAEQRRRQAEEEAKKKRQGTQTGAQTEKASSGQADAKAGASTNGDKKLPPPPLPKCSSALWGAFAKLYKRATEEMGMADALFRTQAREICGDTEFRQWDEATMQKNINLISARLDEIEEEIARTDEQTKGGTQ